METIQNIARSTSDFVTVDLLSIALQITAPSEGSNNDKLNRNESCLFHWTDGLSHIAATSAYRSAIESNAKIFYGKTVLDIRGGTGK